MGPENASSIILNAKYWADPNFPTKKFFKQEARDETLAGNLHHTKFIVSAAITEQKKGEERQKFAVSDYSVLYFGSHNLSPSAWGNMEKNGTQLGINNTELGILFPAQLNSKAFKQNIIDMLPIAVPPAKYGQQD